RGAQGVNQFSRGAGAGEALDQFADLWFVARALLITAETGVLRRLGLADQCAKGGELARTESGDDHIAIESAISTKGGGQRVAVAGAGDRLVCIKVQRVAGGKKREQGIEHRHIKRGAR